MTVRTPARAILPPPQSVRPSVRPHTGNRCEMLHWALSIYQKLWETYMERSIQWRTCFIWHKFHSFMLSSPKLKKMAEVSSWLAWNCLAKTLKWNMHFHWMVSKAITGLPFQFSSYIADSGVDPSRLRVFFFNVYRWQVSSFQIIAGSTLFGFLQCNGFH